MTNITNLLSLLKQYKTEIKTLKIMVLVIINIWLLFIFWKIIALDGINITNNNVALIKMNTLLQPLLHILGLNMLSPNTIKMIIISVIVIISNLAVLYFSQMMAFLLLGLTARYSYKAYNNYINKDTLSYYGFEIEKILTDTEKTTILNEFIKNNNITDFSLIGFLQNKVNNINCSSKNELILNINNNFLDYKQQIINQTLIQQKEQIMLISRNSNTRPITWVESIDFSTIIKIGGVIILTGIIIMGGYYLFNANATAAGEIGKKALDGAEQGSKIALEHTNETAQELLNNTNNIAGYLNSQIIETNKSISELTGKVLEFNTAVTKQNDNIVNFTKNINEQNAQFISQVTNIQENCVNTAKQALYETESLSKITQSLTSQTQNINNTLTNINTQLQKNDTIISNLNTQLNGGDKLYTTEGLIQKEIPSLAQQVHELTEATSGTISSIRAILTFLGLDVALNTEGLRMIERIRAVTRRENVFQQVLEAEDLSGIEPVNADNLNNIEQEQLPKSRDER